MAVPSEIPTTFLLGRLDWNAIPQDPIVWATGVVVAIGGAGLGNVLEWYDFTVYAYLAGIIGKKFFDSSDSTAALLATFAVFGVGFAASALLAASEHWRRATFTLGAVPSRRARVVRQVLRKAWCAPPARSVASADLEFFVFAATNFWRISIHNHVGCVKSLST